MDAAAAFHDVDGGDLHDVAPWETIGQHGARRLVVRILEGGHDGIGVENDEIIECDRLEPRQRWFLRVALAACRDRYGLVISGLMCIPPHDDAPGPHFALTAKIAGRNGLKLLSMGMSADYAIAIAMGATHVRIGSAIFGGRG